MRWPFGHRSTPAAAATGPSAAPARPAAERPRDAWRSLPAVQRLVGAPPVVAPAAPFAEALATRQPAGLALAPLGHEVSSLATPGLLIGVASAGAPGAAAISGRVDLPLQRHAETDVSGELAWSAFETAAESREPEPVDQPGEGPIPALVASIQRLAAPAPLLTTAAATEVRAAPAGRLDLRPPAMAPASPALAVVQRAPATAGDASDAAGQAGQPGPAVPPAPARRPTLGEARRLGLGAPLRSAADLNVQRSETSLAGGWQPAMPVVPASMTGALSMQSLGAGGPAMAGVPASVLTPGTPSGDEMTEPPEPVPTELTVVQPLSVERLRSFAHLGIQRSIAALAPDADASPSSALLGRDEPPSSAGPGAFAEPDPRAVSGSASRDVTGPVATVDKVTTAGSPAESAPLGGSPIRATSGGLLLRPPVTGPALAGRGPGPAQPAGSGPVVARTMDTGARTANAPAGAPGHPMAAQLAALGIAVHQEPAGPVVQRRSPAEAPAAEPGSSPPAGVTVVALQRAVEIGEMQVGSSSTGSHAGAAAGSTSASADTAGSASLAASTADRERELDELARRLYGRIRSRLASELLADRERAGLLVDLR